MDIEVMITANERDLVKGLRTSANEAEKLGQTTDKTNKSIQAGYNSSARAVNKFSKETKQANAEVQKSAKQSRSFRSQIRNLSRAATGLGLVGAFSAITAAVEAGVEAYKRYRMATDATFAIQQRAAGAVKEGAAAFIEQKIELDGLFGAITSANEGTKEYRDAIDAVNERYPDLLQNQLSYTSSLEDIEAAQRAANDALLDNIVAEQQRRIYQELAVELANAAIVQQKYTEAAEGTSEAWTTFSNLFGVLTVRNFAEAADTNVDVLTEQINRIDEVGETLRETFAALDITALEDLSAGYDDTGKNAEKANKAVKKTAEVAAPAAGSIDALTKQLSELDKQINAVGENAPDVLMQLVEERAVVAAELEAAQQQIKELSGEAAAERLEIEKALTNELLMNEQERARAAVTIQAATREQQINEAVEDEERRAELLKANALRLTEDLREIDEQYQNEKINAQAETTRAIIENRGEELEADIQLQAAILRERQSAELLAAQQAGATEAQLTEINAQQAKERERLTLESERRRLELVLEFAEGRSEAEIQTTRATINAINSELDALDFTPEAEGEAAPVSLLERLGLTPDQIAGVQQAVALVTQQLNDLFNKQIELTAAAVAARDENIQDLESQLQTELERREQGFANNVDLVRSQLAEENAARDEALQQQQKAQRAQILLESATQASSLITASTNIFQSLSSIPFVGVPLAVGVIASLFGAFAATKAKAIQATKLYKGGKIRGYTNDKHGRGIEIGQTGQYVGGGEYVVPYAQTLEHEPFLAALSAGRYDGVDISSILEGITAADKNTAGLMVKVEKAEQERTAAAYERAVRSGLEEQTRVISRKLDKIYTRTDYKVKDGERVEIRRDVRGNVSINKIKQLKS